MISRTGRGADRIDFLEKHALSFKAVDRNSDDFVCHDDGGVTAKVRAVDRYAIPCDGAEAAILRAGRSVLHAADGCFESRQRVVGRARSNADVGSTNAGKFRVRDAVENPFDRIFNGHDLALTLRSLHDPLQRRV